MMMKESVAININLIVYEGGFTGSYSPPISGSCSQSSLFNHGVNIPQSIFSCSVKQRPHFQRYKINPLTPPPMRVSSFLCQEPFSD